MAVPQHVIVCPFKGSTPTHTSGGAPYVLLISGGAGLKDGDGAGTAAWFLATVLSHWQLMIRLVRRLTAMAFHIAELFFPVAGHPKMQSNALAAPFASWGVDSKSLFF